MKQYFFILLMSRLIFPLLLIIPLCSYLIWIGSDLELLESVSQKTSLVLAVSSVVCGISIFFTPLENIGKKYSILLIGAGILIVAGVYWNILFEFYIRATDYHNDIFRGAMRNYHSPVYGVSLISKWPWGAVLISFSFVFIMRVVCWRITWLEHNLFVIELLMWFLCLIIAFSLSDGPERLLDTVGHYQSFASDIPIFKGFGHALRTYTQEMPRLSVHNAHYPPGNLLLMMAGSRLEMPWLPRSIVITFTLLTLFPISGIISEFNSSTYAKNISLALFVSSPVVLSIPSVAMTPIPMFLSSSALWLTLVAIRKESILASIATGFIMALCSFLSFTSIVIACLLFFVTFARLTVYGSKSKVMVILKQGLIAIISFLLLCWLCYIITGFNLLVCFITGVEHNRSIMASGYDSMFRYLLRSTGNLIAWLCSIGFVAAIFGIVGGSNALCSSSRKNHRIATYNYSVLITVFFASFSTLFFLETERIWLFFVPPWVTVAGMYIAEDTSIGQKPFLIKSIIIFSILQGTGQEFIFRPWLG